METLIAAASYIFDVREADTLDHAMVVAELITATVALVTKTILRIIEACYV